MTIDDFKEKQCEEITRLQRRYEALLAEILAARAMRDDLVGGEYTEAYDQARKESEELEK